jgi:hypothetical protein
MTGLIVVASLLIAFFVFGWLLKVAKATIGTALAIAAVVLGLQLFFGVGPEELWLQMTQLWNTQFAKIWESLWRSVVK